ncbi:hypothetical protein HRS9139_06268 [Pyrenophora teres f. teres]|nr:hypothetical protein HRS9139_06268 [Pyrenophora teres f. teres]
MSQPTHLLFPNLPPELRQEIYTYLSEDPSTPAQTTGLPLALKTFTCKHTTIQILPVHHGSAGLLSLPHDVFPEAAEYHSWLLSNAVALHIGVKFHGRVNTFVQADWDKKVERHLNKLAKQHPWLRKVGSYHVKICWAPLDKPLRSKKGKRVAGCIPNAMVESLTKMMDEGGIHVSVSSFLIAKEEGVVEWVEGLWEQLVMRKTYVDADEGEVVVTYGQKQPEYSFRHVLMECMGQI